MARDIKTDVLTNTKGIFQEGFKNDTTPLDESTLNQLVDGILLNNNLINNLNNNFATDSELNQTRESIIGEDNDTSDKDTIKGAKTFATAAAKTFATAAVNTHNSSDVHITSEERTKWDNKVDSEDGKGLSTNDFTNEYKDKLDSIAQNAEVNVQSDWEETDTNSDAFIQNKPTKLSDFDNDCGFLTEHQDISGKEDSFEILEIDGGGAQDAIDQNW